MRLLPRQRAAAVLIADGTDHEHIFAKGWGRGSGKTVTLRAARLLLAVRRGQQKRAESERI